LDSNRYRTLASRVYQLDKPVGHASLAPTGFNRAERRPPTKHRTFRTVREPRLETRRTGLKPNGRLLLIALGNQKVEAYLGD